jgi:CBS domain-containing protein
VCFALRYSRLKEAVTAIEVLARLRMRRSQGGIFHYMEIGPLVTGVVVTVGPDHTLDQAARRMAERNVGSAIVSKDYGQPGIITERDLLRAIADGVDLDSTRVEDYMTANAITASTSWDVNEAARRMIDGGFRHLVVLGPDGEVKGVLSIRDLVKSLMQEAEHA